MDKNEIKRISKCISNSKMMQDKRYKNLLTYITTTNTKDIAETFIECCLMYNVDCEYIIDKYTEFKNDELNDSDFKKILTRCMIFNPDNKTDN